MEQSPQMPEADVAIDTIYVRRMPDGNWIISATFIDLPMVYSMDYREEAMAWAADLASNAARPILIVADPDPEELADDGEANGPEGL